MKDYYKIMDVSPNATQEEIRRAYRRQVIKYHPDKNLGNTETVNLFLDIQEAYIILSDEKQRRKFHLNSHYPFTDIKNAPTITSESILVQCQSLQSIVRSGNHFRINKKMILSLIESILSKQNIAVLQKENNSKIIDQSFRLLLEPLKILPYKLASKELFKLLALSGHLPKLKNEIQQLIQDKKRVSFWENYQTILILLATLLICLFILYLGS